MKASDWTKRIKEDMDYYRAKPHKLLDDIEEVLENIEGYFYARSRFELKQIDHFVYFDHLDPETASGYVYFHGGKYDGFRVDRMDDGSIKLYGIKLKDESD